MNEDEIGRRYKSLSADEQLRVLPTFGHNLTIAARDTYEVRAPGIRATQQLHDMNEVQHRVFAHIVALLTVDAERYPDDVLLGILLEHGDEHLRTLTLCALEDALQRHDKDGLAELEFDDPFVVRTTYSICDVLGRDRTPHIDAFIQQRDVNSYRSHNTASATPL